MSAPIFEPELCDTSPDGEHVICPLCGQGSVARHSAEAAIEMENAYVSQPENTRTPGHTEAKAEPQEALGPAEEADAVQ